MLRPCCRTVLSDLLSEPVSPRFSPSPARSLSSVVCGYVLQSIAAAPPLPPSRPFGFGEGFHAHTRTRHGAAHACHAPRACGFLLLGVCAGFRVVRSCVRHGCGRTHVDPYVAVALVLLACGGLGVLGSCCGGVWCSWFGLVLLVLLVSFRFVSMLSCCVLCAC